MSYAQLSEDAVKLGVKELNRYKRDAKRCGTKYDKSKKTSLQCSHKEIEAVYRLNRLAFEGVEDVY